FEALEDAELLIARDAIPPLHVVHRSTRAGQSDASKSASTACGQASDAAPAALSDSSMARNSTFPELPVIGDRIAFVGQKSDRRAASPTWSRTARWTAGSRTTPPLGTASRPASNCGLTNAT